MTGKTAIACCCATLVVLVAAYFGLGGVAQWFVVTAVGVWIWMPLGVATLLYAMLTVRSNGWLSLRPLGWVVGIALAAFISCGLGERLCEWEIGRAKKSGIEVARRVDGYLAATGSLPSSFAEVDRHLTIPRLLRYERMDDHFDMVVYDPRELFLAWAYNAETGQWTKRLND